MTMRTNLHDSRTAARGFTLIELLVTIAILSVVMVTITTIMIAASRSRTAAGNAIQSTQAAQTALQMLTDDIRTAGYGADGDYTASPQPAIAYVDSLQILFAANLSPYPDTTTKFMPPRAYQPTGSPRPKPLDGTSWQPPIKYRTGAEMIRWTLDANNDGRVDANDQAAAEGIDAMRTRNPTTTRCCARSTATRPATSPATTAARPSASRWSASRAAACARCSPCTCRAARRRGTGPRVRCPPTGSRRSSASSSR